jgi:dihydroorotate dehydrogenase (fumarate)
VRFALEVSAAGADALELNLFEVPVDPAVDAAELEARSLEVVRAVCKAIDVPVALKLSPFYSALPNFARRAVEAGARGLVLFNRFYEPALDVEALDLRPHATLSTPSELGLRLRWIGILSGLLDGTSLAVSGGVHQPLDAVRALMAGADAVQVVSALLAGGPGRLATLRDGLEAFLVEHEYESLAQLRGSLNLRRCPDPTAYRRANYARTLQTWPGEARGWERAGERGSAG